MAYIKFGKRNMIHQTTKLKWSPNILVMRYYIGD